MAKSSSKKSKPAKSAPAASPAPGDRGPAIDIGLSTADRKKIAQGLSVFLSDAYTLYLKTHNFHWNVTGPMFNSLRSEEHTSELQSLMRISYAVFCLKKKKKIKKAFEMNI